MFCLVFIFNACMVSFFFSSLIAVFMWERICNMNVYFLRCKCLLKMWEKFWEISRLIKGKNSKFHKFIKRMNINHTSLRLKFVVWLDTRILYANYFISTFYRLIILLDFINMLLAEKVEIFLTEGYSFKCRLLLCIQFLILIINCN